ncbi:MAG: hypothetical protein Q9195_000209 [Heterodermia aff. obscurata]
MANFLITGCSRGLGLELVTQLAASPPNGVQNVIATTRGETSAALKTLVQSLPGRIHYIKLDATDPASVKAAAARVSDFFGSIDVLINNAGSINWRTGSIDKMDDLNRMFHNNVNSAQIVTAAFIPLLEKGTLKKVINMSTSVGSMKMASRFTMMHVPSYKVSKAALNMLTVQWALEYQNRGFTFMAISPGWLKTDIGGIGADLTVAEGAGAVLKLINSKGTEANGKFFNVHVAGWETSPGTNQYDGAELPW